MTAINATLLGFPLDFKRSYNSLQEELNWMADQEEI